MLTEPSVKGLLLIGSVKAIRSAIKGGDVARESVELMLTPGDLEILDSKIESTRWYPVGMIGRLQEILAKMVGGDRIAALRRLGALAAGDVRDTGTYDQMDFEEGTLESASHIRRVSFARRSATLNSMMFNFGTSRIEVDEANRDTLIHYEEVGEFPDSMRYTIQGFTEAVARIASGVDVPVSLEEIHPDRFTLRIGSAE